MSVEDYGECTMYKYVLNLTQQRHVIALMLLWNKTEPFTIPIPVNRVSIKMELDWIAFCFALFVVSLVVTQSNFLMNRTAAIKFLSVAQQRRGR